MLSWRAIHRRIPWLDWPAIVLIAIVGFLSFKYEDFKEDFPRLITWQLHAYQWITNHSGQQLEAHWITPVEIDDTTFYEFLHNETRNEVTDRKFLAQLVDAATRAGAGAIALDINLDETSSDRVTASANNLNGDDEALFTAILNAQKARIPVILTFGFREGLVPVPQIFDRLPVYDGRGISYRFPEDEVPTPRPAWAARYGFDHPADDLRKVPLVTIGYDGSGKSYDFYSFALQITDAYTQSLTGALKQAGHAPVPETKVLADQLTHHEFVYTTFMPRSAFISPQLQAFGQEQAEPLSAIEVFCGPLPGKNWEVELCKDRNPGRVELAPGLMRGHIVLVGGHRHGYRGETGEGDYLDTHLSPVGLLRGMYFQANYVEGLLDNRVLYKVNRWWAAFIDVALAAFMLWVVGLKQGFLIRTLMIVLLLFLPIMLAWLAAVTVQRCLDFMFPLVLLLLHPAIESYIHLVHGSHHHEVAHD
jgi:CHASE2 domain-containing sensor protein